MLVAVEPGGGGEVLVEAHALPPDVRPPVPGHELPNALPFGIGRYIPPPGELLDREVEALFLDRRRDVLHPAAPVADAVSWHPVAGDILPTQGPRLHMV